MDLEKHPASAAASAAVLRYVTETQKNRPVHINSIQWYESKGYLVLDDIAKRNLELFSTITDNNKEGSLLHVLDETVTAMGARRLRWWLNYPLCEPGKIRERLAAVGEIKENHLLRDVLRKALSRRPGGESHYRKPASYPAGGGDRQGGLRFGIGQVYCPNAGRQTMDRHA